MPKPRSEKMIKKEKLIDEALPGLENCPYKTPYDAAKALGVSQSTLYRRAAGGKSRVQASEEQQNLTVCEERALAGLAIVRPKLEGQPNRRPKFSISSRLVSGFLVRPKIRPSIRLPLTSGRGRPMFISTQHEHNRLDSSYHRQKYEKFGRYRA